LHGRQAALAGTDTIQFGEGLSGSFAAGLLTEGDAELDFDASVLKLFPEGGPPRDGWARGTDAIQHKGLPSGSAFLFADVALNGQPLRCGLDTGFAQPMRVTASTAKRLGLEGRNWSPGARGMRAVRVDTLEFSGQHYQRPIVLMQPPAENSDTYGDGLIGLPLIRQFNLATDVKADLLWTRRNKQMAEAPRYNMAGVWLDRTEGGATVGAVGKGSPAEASGLMQGDAVRGDFATLIKGFTGPPGSQVTLPIVGRTGLREVSLTLADYL